MQLVPTQKPTSIPQYPHIMTTQVVKVLAKLASQMGVPSEEGGSKSDGASLLIREDDDDDCDFSSFPSLSLEETPGNYHTGVFMSRRDVESHIESLLSRPILLGPQPADEPVGDSLDEFFVERLEDVPKVMMANFATSFSTLMNSRLRAYATFLARHAISIAQCSEEMDRVVGIERKLETMLAIGSQVCATRVSSSFEIDPKGAQTVEGDEGEASQVAVPLKANLCVYIQLPHVKEADGNELMNVSLHVNGRLSGKYSSALPPRYSSQFDSRKSNTSVHPSITGIFINKADDEALLLRVVEVTLDMHELLTGMAEEASKVISCIVEMTNAAYAIPLPVTPNFDPTKEAEGSAPAVSEGGEYPLAVPVAPTDVVDIKKHNRDNDEEDSIRPISEEKFANIVDCLIGELYDTVLSPPCAKKVKIHEEGEPLFCQ